MQSTSRMVRRRIASLVVVLAAAGLVTSCTSSTAGAPSSAPARAVTHPPDSPTVRPTPVPSMPRRTRSRHVTVSSLRAPRLYRHTQTAMTAQFSFRMRVRTSSAEAAGLAMDVDFSDGDATARVGHEFTVLLVGGALYLRAPARFWVAYGSTHAGGLSFSPAQADKLAGKWIAASADDPITTNLLFLLDPEGLIDQLLPPGGDAHASRRAPTKVNGMRVIPLVFGLETCDVSTASGLLVRAKRAPLTFAFSKYGHARSRSVAPDPAKIVDGKPYGL